jgi:hypothetical protein
MYCLSKCHSKYHLLVSDPQKSVDLVLTTVIRRSDVGSALTLSPFPRYCTACDSTLSRLSRAVISQHRLSRVYMLRVLYLSIRKDRD